LLSSLCKDTIITQEYNKKREKGIWNIPHLGKFDGSIGHSWYAFKGKMIIVPYLARLHSQILKP